MSEHLFQGTLYPTAGHMCIDIARQWATADGANSGETVAKLFADHTDRELAAEVVRDLGLDREVEEHEVAWEPEDGPRPTWMEMREIEVRDLAVAFGDLRDEFVAA